MKKYRVYPFGNFSKKDKSCWWLVKVLPDDKSFKKALKERCNVCECSFDGDEDVPCNGLTHSHRFKQKADLFGQIHKANVKGELGVVFLQEDYTGGGVVAHEMAHAMLYTVMRGTSTINFMCSEFGTADEYIAGIVGNLVQGFYSRHL